MPVFIYFHTVIEAFLILQIYRYWNLLILDTKQMNNLPIQFLIHCQYLYFYFQWSKIVGKSINLSPAKFCGSFIVQL